MIHFSIKYFSLVMRQYNDTIYIVWHVKTKYLTNLGNPFSVSQTRLSDIKCIVRITWCVLWGFSPSQWCRRVMLWPSSVLRTSARGSWEYPHQIKCFCLGRHSLPIFKILSLPVRRKGKQVLYSTLVKFYGETILYKHTYRFSIEWCCTWFDNIRCVDVHSILTQIYLSRCYITLYSPHRLWWCHQTALF